MRDVVNAWVVFFGYAVLAVFAQNAIFTRALGVSRLVQLVGDDRTSSWLFGLQLCITQVLVAPLGSEQGGIRPVLIIQNDVGNRHSPTVICAAITSKMNKAKLPTHIEIDASAYGIEKDSVILLEQLRTIDKRRLKDKVCHLDSAMLDKVNHALEISLELTF